MNDNVLYNKVELFLARLVGQYCDVARGRLSLSSVVVCNAAGERAGGQTGYQARGRSAAVRPGAWAVRRPTLHGRPVLLRPVRTIPC